MSGLFADLQRRSGILGTAPTVRSFAPPTARADALDEIMFAASPNGDPVLQREGAAILQEPRGLLSAPQSGGGLLSPRPMSVARRGFEFLMGGTDGIDRVRDNREREAMAPVLRQERARLAALAEQMGPAAQIAFATNPEKFGESLAEQYAPQVIAAGAVQSVVGNGQRVAAPSFDEFGDSMVRRDPLTGAVDTVATRGPTFAEQTGRINATNPVNVAPGGQLRDPNTGELIAQGAERVFSAADGAQLYGEGGGMIAENAKDAPPPSAADNEDRAAIQGFRAVNDRFSNLIAMVGGDPETGAPPAFELSPLRAAGYKAALRTGIGMSPEAAAYGDYVSEIKAAVADALRLNVGPQTDQDAIREAEALLSNVDNKEYVLRRLPTVIANNDRLRQGRETLLNQRRPAGQSGNAPSTSGAPVRVSSPQEAQALPSGTQFVTPDGQVRVKR